MLTYQSLIGRLEAFQPGESIRFKTYRRPPSFRSIMYSVILWEFLLTIFFLEL